MVESSCGFGCPSEASEMDVGMDETCFSCGTMLGKRRLKPRHHCRICARPVCAQCSPARVPLEGERGVQRACTPCALYAYKAPALGFRLQRLADQLQALAGLPVLDRPEHPPEDHFGDHALEDALKACEDSARMAAKRQHALELQLEQTEEQLKQRAQLAQVEPSFEPASSPALSYLSAIDLSFVGSTMASAFGSAAVCGQGGSCELCNVLLGKRHFKPRHHCRICRRLVCGPCSKSSVQFEHKAGVNRACIECAVNAQKAPALTEKMKRLAGSLYTVSGKPCTTLQLAETMSLEGAVRLCETGLRALGEKQGAIWAHTR
jgi:hypothetical protein